ATTCSAWYEVSRLRCTRAHASSLGSSGRSARRSVSSAICACESSSVCRRVSASSAEWDGAMGTHTSRCVSAGVAQMKCNSIWARCKANDVELTGWAACGLWAKAASGGRSDSQSFAFLLNERHMVLDVARRGGQDLFERNQAAFAVNALPLK